MSSDRFTLDRHERDSAVWKRLKAHLESELDIQRKKNDGDLPPDQTNRVRGNIARIKALLALDRDPAQVADDGI